MTLNGRQRRALVIGALALVALLGLGLWPMGETRTYSSDSSAILGPDDAGPTDANGGAVVTWEASESCSVLLGSQSLTTADKPDAGLVRPSDTCTTAEANRLWLLLAMAAVVLGTAVAVAWCAERSPAAAAEP